MCCLRKYRKLLILALFLVSTCMPASLNAQVINVNVAFDTQPGSIAEWAAQNIALRLNRSSYGKILSKPLVSSSGYTESQLTSAVLLGDVQLAVVPVRRLLSYSQRLRIFDLPFFFSDLDEVVRFESGKSGRSFLTSLKPKGLVGLGYINSGMQQLSSIRIVKKPEDAAGLSFSYDDTPGAGAILDILKAKRLMPALTDTMRDLVLDGRVDVYRGTWSEIASSGVVPSLPNITLTAHSPRTYIVVASVEFIKDISRLSEDAIRTAVTTVIAEANQRSVNSELFAQSQLVKYPGVIVSELTPDERQAWRQRFAPLFEGIGEIEIPIAPKPVESTKVPEQKQDRISRYPSQGPLSLTTGVSGNSPQNEDKSGVDGSGNWIGDSVLGLGNNLARAIKENSYMASPGTDRMHHD